MHPISVVGSDRITNVGDLASLDETVSLLAERGICARRWRGPLPKTADESLVIGGGHLLQDRYPEFAIRGPHILNAVAISPGFDVGYLRDYRYVSVRDGRSSEILAAAGIAHAVVPCPAFGVRPVPLAEIAALPRWAPARHLKRGEYAVVHARPELYGIANGCTDPVVAVEPAPYTWMPWEANGWRAPWTHSASVVAGLIASAKVVVTLSLHMAIFAVAAGVPVCAPVNDTDQGHKLRSYFERAGFPAIASAGKNATRYAIEIAPQQRKVRADEQERLRQHADAIAQALKG